MNKTDLIRKVAAETGYTQKDVAPCVDAVFNVITETVKNGEVVSITNFGKFDTKELNARTCINPIDRTKTVDVPASKNMKFKPSSVIKQIMNA